MNTTTWRRLFNAANNPFAAKVMMTTPAWGQGPWSGSNNLGNVVNFAPDANNRQSVLKLDEWGPPDVWTISLGITYGNWPYPGPTPAFNVNADIVYGVGGATQLLKCSWRNGTSISLPMNAINVSAIYASSDYFGTFKPPPNLRLSAIIARGYQRSNAYHLTPCSEGKTNGTGVGPGTVYIDVPPFASEVTILSPDMSTTGDVWNAANVFRLLNGTQNYDGSIAITQYPTADIRKQWVPIPPFAYSAGIYAPASLGLTSFHLLWKIGA